MDSKRPISPWKIMMKRLNTLKTTTKAHRKSLMMRLNAFKKTITMLRKSLTKRLNASEKTSLEREKIKRKKKTEIMLQLFSCDPS